MNAEFDILMNIYTDLTNNIEYIKKSQYNFKNIKNNINNFENDYFKKYCNDKLFTEYLNMYRDIDDYDKQIEKLIILRKNIEDKLKNLCNHEWVEDVIDIHPEKCKYICYCMYCEITMK
jgi:hypothetical protein